MIETAQQGQPGQRGLMRLRQPADHPLKKPFFGLAVVSNCLAYFRQSERAGKRLLRGHGHQQCVSLREFLHRLRQSRGFYSQIIKELLRIAELERVQIIISHAKIQRQLRWILAAHHRAQSRAKFLAAFQHVPQPAAQAAVAGALQSLVAVEKKHGAVRQSFG